MVLIHTGHRMMKVAVAPKGKYVELMLIGDGGASNRTIHGTFVNSTKLWKKWNKKQPYKMLKTAFDLVRE